jgi:hypothetical protein
MTLVWLFVNCQSAGLLSRKSLDPTVTFIVQRHKRRAPLGSDPRKIFSAVVLER